MGTYFTVVIIIGVVLIGSTPLLCEGYQTTAPASNALQPSATYVAASTTPLPHIAPSIERAPTLRPSNNTIQPCSCAVFLTDQFKKGSTEQPNGPPVVRHELEKTFPCTPLGTRQCQNKCLEAFIKHLPNAGTILCGTMDRDCHKAKAFLFIQNCNNKWINSNLSSGREICCKNGESYPCPLI